MKRPLAIFLACTLCGGALAVAQEPTVLHKEPLPVIPTEPVAVPETVGASLLAGVGFFMLFRRRRYA